MTVEIPLALLARVEPDGFSWLVPALREELVTALLKALPKAIRKNVVPAADWARKLGPLIEERRGATRLETALAEAIRAQTYTPTSPDDFELDRVPAHLRMTFAAIDDRGKRLGTSKDLGELQTRFADRTRTSVATGDRDIRAGPLDRTHGHHDVGHGRDPDGRRRARSAPAQFVAIRRWWTRGQMSPSASSRPRSSSSVRTRSGCDACSPSLCPARCRTCRST